MAEREGISINQLINSAVAEKLAALMTEEYLEQRAARGSRRKLRRVLAKVPDVKPAKGGRNTVRRCSPPAWRGLIGSENRQSGQLRSAARSLTFR